MIGPGGAAGALSSRGRFGAQVDVGGGGGGGAATSVDSLSRDIGGEAGGPSMTITGTGFSGTPEVLFGAGNQASSVVVDSSTQITCNIPSGTGTVAVSVAGVSGPDFEYIPAPTAHLNKAANFEDDTFGDWGTTVSTGNSVTIITDAGNGPEGSDKFARCLADVDGGGGSNAYVDANDAGNTPVHGNDGLWLSWFIRVEDATVAQVENNGQIKLTLYRGGGTCRWVNNGMGPQFTADGGEVTVAVDTGCPGDAAFDGDTGGPFRPVITTLGTSKGWTRIDRQFIRSGGTGTARYFVDGKLATEDSGVDTGNDGTGTYNQEAGVAFHQQTLGTGDLVVDVGGIVLADGYVENISGA